MGEVSLPAVRKKFVDTAICVEESVYIIDNTHSLACINISLAGGILAAQLRPFPFR